VEPVEEFRPTPAPVEEEAEPYQESGEATGTWERRPSPPVTPDTEDEAPEEGGMFSDRLAELDRAADEVPDTSDTATDRPDRSTGRSSSQPADSTARASGSSGDPSDVEIQWDDPAEGRDIVKRVEPDVPDWVKYEGLTLAVEYAFVLTPQGLLTQLTLQKSSGYSDVDAAVREALRLWKFRQIQGTKRVQGSVQVSIRPKR
jgi:TonB family protein